MQEQDPPHFPDQLPVLAPGAGLQLHAHPPRLPRHLRGLLRLRLGQHPLLDQETDLLNTTPCVGFSDSIVHRRSDLAQPRDTLDIAVGPFG